MKSMANNNSNNGNGNGHSHKGKPPGRYCIKRVAMCSACHADGLKPKEQSLEIGATDWGLQIFCSRHNKNVAHLSFVGQNILWNVD